MRLSFALFAILVLAVSSPAEAQRRRHTRQETTREAPPVVETVPAGPRLAPEADQAGPRPDPDLEARIAEAEALARSGQHDRAAAMIVDMWSQTDRFVVAQRALLADRAAALVASGQATDRATALAWRDAAWAIRGRAPDVEYARSLVEASSEVSDEQAAYLATRAAEVDPSNEDAADLRDRLTTDHTNDWAWIATGAAGVSAITGFVLWTLAAGSNKAAEEDAQTLEEAQSLVDEAATMEFAAWMCFGTAVLSGGIATLLFLLDDSVDAVSPDYLPALPDSGTVAESEARPAHW